MRLIFTGYAINSAAVCLMLSFALMVFGEDHVRFNQCVDLIADYMYLAFGPVLFLFCLFGFSALPSLAYECLPNRIGNKLNLMDVLILFICATMSFTILFMFSLSKVNRLAETDLSDDTSMFYQVFVSFMKSKRSQYLEEKRRRRLRTEQNYRQEEIKDQEDEIRLLSDADNQSSPRAPASASIPI